MNQLNITVTTKRLRRIISMSRLNCASEGTAAFGVSSDGAAVAELAPLSEAFMSLAICKACVEDFY